MSGQQTYNCFGDKKPNLKRICIDSMSDRAFNVYTEFYSHTQNMCFYLYNRMWHEKAEETINLLNYNTEYVNEQLELAKNLQSGLLEQQKRGLEIQEILMKQGLKLSSELKISQSYVQNIAENFTTSAKEHGTLLIDIFSKLNFLQKWLLGEMSWLSSICYYIVFLIGILILSSTEKTHNSRLQMLFVYMFNLVMEYTGTYHLSYYISAAETFQTYNSLYKTVLRYFCIILSGSIFVKHMICYKNYDKDNHQLIIEVRKQLADTMQCLNEIKVDHTFLMSFLKQLALDGQAEPKFNITKNYKGIDCLKFEYNDNENKENNLSMDNETNMPGIEDESFLNRRYRLRNKKLEISNGSLNKPVKPNAYHKKLHKAL